jgi:hypothetical protein
VPDNLDTIFLGLTQEEFDKLRTKGAIGFNKAQTGFAVNIIICYSETEAGLADRLRENGATIVLTDTNAEDARQGMLADPNFKPGPNKLALPPTPGVPSTWPTNVLLEIANPSSPRAGWRIACRDPFNELMIVAAHPSKLDLRIKLEAAGYARDRELSMNRELWRRA